MNKLKLMTIIGTRPEIIKLSETIKLCDQYFDHILVHTGQNYDYQLNQIFFDDLGLREPDHYLNVVGNDLGETLGNILNYSYRVLKEVNPDALLVLGDTNSGLSVLSAKRLKIPVFHLEAGNRCFDENLPEEINRRLIDHASDVNLCYTEHARRYLMQEGRPMDRTFVIGSPMLEVIKRNELKIKKCHVLERLGLKEKQYMLLSAHREENIDNEMTFKSLLNSLNNVVNEFDVPIIYSVHPRTKKALEKANFNFNKKIVFLEPLNFSDYMALQIHALAVLSDSGTLAEEASIFKFPAISLRSSTERPEALDSGTMTIGNVNAESIIQAIHIAINFNRDNLIGSNVRDYEAANFSMKVVNIIQSYQGIINQKVWGK